jgi:hypothetical protein
MIQAVRSVMIGVGTLTGPGEGGGSLQDVFEGPYPNHKKREEERGKKEWGTSLRVEEGDGRTKRNPEHFS